MTEEESAKPTAEQQDAFREQCRKRTLMMGKRWAAFILKLLVDFQQGQRWEQADDEVSVEIALWISQAFPELFDTEDRPFDFLLIPEPPPTSSPEEP